MDSTGGTTRLSFLKRLRDRGDSRSWTEFHRHYGELLFSYARRLGASQDWAEDIVQEVELAVFRAIERFEPRHRKGSFRAYLRSSVVHALGRRARKDGRREAMLDPRAFDALAKTDAALDKAWQREQYLHRLRWALRSITLEFEPVTLEAFRLHVLANQPAAMTAGALGISKASVYQAKSRVLKRLRERISSLDSDLRV
jgi:RNA polymerase sigma-70 factor (ECF subfamily)